MNFCPGELILKLLARIGEWHQNLSEKTALIIGHCTPETGNHSGYYEGGDRSIRRTGTVGSEHSQVSDHLLEQLPSRQLGMDACA